MNEYLTENIGEIIRVSQDAYNPSSTYIVLDIEEDFIVLYNITEDKLMYSKQEIIGDHFFISIVDRIDLLIEGNKLRGNTEGSDKKIELLKKFQDTLYE